MTYVAIQIPVKCISHMSSGIRFFYLFIYGNFFMVQSCIKNSWHSPQNYWRQKAIAAKIVFQVKIISGKNLSPSLFSLKYNNKKTLKVKYNSYRKSLYSPIFIGFRYVLVMQTR